MQFNRILLLVAIILPVINIQAFNVQAPVLPYVVGDLQVSNRALLRHLNAEEKKAIAAAIYPGGIELLYGRIEMAPSGDEPTDSAISQDNTYKFCSDLARLGHGAFVFRLGFWNAQGIPLCPALQDLIHDFGSILPDGSE
jgi:hypothetical protein